MREIENNKTLFPLLIIIVLFFCHDLIYSQSADIDATLKLININGVQIPYQNDMPVPSFEKQNRKVVNLKGTWKKQRFSADHNLSLSRRDEAGYNSLITEADGRNLVSFDDSAWENKLIPSVENSMNIYPSVPEYYQDGVWYRYKFNAGDSLSGKFVKLIFYSVNYLADVWLNDTYLGYHEGGFTPFAFDVSSILINNGENTIAVRVDNPAWGSRKDIVPFYPCDWFNYTGIIHDVYLEISDNISILRADIVPLNSDGDFKTTIVVGNNNNSAKNVSVDFNVYEADINELNIKSDNAFDIIGNEVPFASLTKISNLDVPADSINVILADLKISSPKLWSPQFPNLYVFKITVKENGVIKDEYFTQFGIRHIKTEGNKVLLNGKVVFFTGVARHEDHPDYGRSLPKEIIYNDLKQINQSNINFLRSGHYPNHPYTYLIADRLGLAVMEEIPVWWFDNELEWDIQNNNRHIHEQMFREMVFKDYNRPSILIWSTSNECKEETNRLIFNERIKNDIIQNYNDQRLVSQSSAGDKPGNADITQNPLDVAGWTLYFGIFHGSTYWAGTTNFLVQAKNNFPDKPLLDTEFGYWSSENGSSSSTQVTVFDETFRALKFFSPLKENGTINQSGCLMGVTWWCFYDWYTHQQKNGFQSMGLIAMDRLTEKPVYNKLVNGYAPYFNNGGMVTTGIEEKKNFLPENYKLNQNYPNPFNPNTVIEFSLPYQSSVIIELYNLIGERIQTLAEGIYSGGFHKVIFESSNISSGVYFYFMRVNSEKSENVFYSVKKMIVLK